MIGFITNRFRDWNQMRRERHIRNLTEEIARYQRRIQNIYQQLIIYCAEYDWLMYMRQNEIETEGDSYGDDIRLIILKDDIIHLPLQLLVYENNVRYIQERLQRLQQRQRTQDLTQSLIEYEHDAVIVTSNE